MRLLRKGAQVTCRLGIGTIVRIYKDSHRATRLVVRAGDQEITIYNRVTRVVSQASTHGMTRMYYNKMVFHKHGVIQWSPRTRPKTVRPIVLTDEQAAKRSDLAENYEPVFIKSELVEPLQILADRALKETTRDNRMDRQVFALALRAYLMHEI